MCYNVLKNGGVYAMLRIFYILTVMVALLLSHSLLYSQQEGSFGFGVYDISRNQPTLTPQRTEEIKAEISQNVMRLKSEGKLPADTEKPKAAVLFSLPLKASAMVKDSGFYGIANFPDHDPAYPNHLSDYNCGTRTFDTASGFNSDGTDFFPWPFPWQKMENNDVLVVAAAAGKIVYREDGNTDRGCAGAWGPSWNAVSIRHSDGSTLWYGNLKKNSVTTKGVGDTVQEGEVIGVIGSSGNSDGPHLHFALYDSADKLTDPFSGDCNKSPSWWKSQRPYYEPSVLRLMTSAVAYEHVACPATTEVTNEKTTFKPGDTVYFTTFFRDQAPSQASIWNIYSPDGTVFKSWLQNSLQYYSASYWYLDYTLPVDAPAGKWRFQVVFNGQTYEQVFNVEAGARTNLKVAKTGTGSGTITGYPSGIDCGLTCSGSFFPDWAVTLTAKPDTGSTIKVWTGCDLTPADNLCMVMMTTDKNITVEFTTSAGKEVENDFDGDGHSDVLWRNTKTGDIYIWLMTESGTKIKSGNLVVKGVPSDWEIKATEDFNGNGKTDVLWQDVTTGDVALWLMDGAKIAGSGYVARAVPSNWQIQATADYNGDGKTDILWQDINTGDVYVQFMDGLKISGGDFATRGLPSDWQTK
ncbi:Peptidase M23 domain protein [Candidatus Magnetobacterium bavaricum]|uniref:Peptidase M23 domain protein n=1 Tax=Candidatus Magnetobacterium bavaricum TaxID=29290 RepID=A0A0F3GM53_9BACT|nr:Peptidase M23 domain protein [Candidatus Magnetobacterium bavaricum]